MLLASQMGETASRARERIQPISESENRDSGEVGEVAKLARFSISLLNIGSVSDQRAADGWVMDGVKKRRRITTQHPSLICEFLPGVCGKLARAGVLGFSRPGQLSAVSVKIGGAVSPVENRSGVAERSEL